MFARMPLSSGGKGGSLKEDYTYKDFGFYLLNTTAPNKSSVLLCSTFFFGAFKSVLIMITAWTTPCIFLS